MIDFELTENKLSGWFNLVFNPVVTPPAEQPVPIIHVWSGEGGVRPAEDYIMLNCTSVKNQGQPYKSAVVVSDLDPNGTQQTVINKAFTLQVQGFGRTAMNMLQTFKDSIDTTEVMEYFYNNSISILDSTDILDVSITEDDGVEKKYAFDVMLVMAVSTGVACGFIENITATGTIINVDLIEEKTVIITEG